ncbi:MAG TPA: DMT family transporter, partial [Steroidobacteraceae bacterium]|nr:DMT family transporter [Steroidobacteraceae bacterium]
CLALILAPFIRWHRGKMGPLLVAAVFAGGLHFSLLLVGLGMADTVSTVAIASQLGVPFATLMSIVVLGEVVRWRRWLGILLAFTGVMVMGLDPAVFRFWQGLACVLLSALFGSLGLMAIKRLDEIRPLELQAWFALISAPLVLIFSLIFESHQLTAIHDAAWTAWGALAFNVLGASLLAHTGYFYLVHRYPVTSVSPLTVLSPLFGVFFAVTLLGDHLTARIIAGGAMTLTGVFIIALREKQIADTGS